MRPRCRCARPIAAVDAAARRLRVVVAHHARAAGRPARAGRRPRRGGIDELVPLVQAETGATMRVGQDHAGAPGRGPIPPLRQGRAGADDPSMPSPRSCRRPRWPPAGSSRRWRTGRRSASVAASPPTTSRSSTWPARSARPWRWATPSSSSRRRRIRSAVIRMVELFDEAGFPPGVDQRRERHRRSRRPRRSSPIAARRHGLLHRLDRGGPPHRRGRRRRA